MEKGDRGAVLAHNRIEIVDILGAVTKAGLVAEPINFRLAGSEIAFIVTDCSVRVLIAEDALAGTVKAIRENPALAESHYIDRRRTVWGARIRGNNPGLL